MDKAGVKSNQGGLKPDEMSELNIARNLPVVYSNKNTELKFHLYFVCNHIHKNKGASMH